MQRKSTWQQQVLPILSLIVLHVLISYLKIPLLITLRTQFYTACVFVICFVLALAAKEQTNILLSKTAFWIGFIVFFVVVSVIAIYWPEYLLIFKIVSGVAIGLLACITWGRILWDMK